MPFRRTLFLIPLTTSLLITTALAQGKPIELGIDAALEYAESNGQDAFNIGIPAQVVRVGFYLSQRVSLEPRLTFTHNSNGGSTFLVPTVGVVYDLATDPSRVRPFLRPFLAMLSNSNGTTTSQFVVGGAVGLRVPLASQLAARFELQTAYGFENDNRASLVSVAGLFGVSFFTK